MRRKSGQCYARATVLLTAVRLAICYHATGTTARTAVSPGAVGGSLGLRGNWSGWCLYLPQRACRETSTTLHRLAQPSSRCLPLRRFTFAMWGCCWALPAAPLSHTA